MSDYKYKRSSAAIEEIQIELDQNTGLKNRMLPRKPMLGEKTEINDTSVDNMSDEDSRTQSDESLLADKTVSASEPDSRRDLHSDCQSATPCADGADAWSRWSGAKCHLTGTPSPASL